MEDNRTAVPESPGDATPGTPTPGTTPSAAALRYAALASTIIAKLHEIVDSIPGFENEHELTRGFVRQKLRLPEDFVREAISALLVLPELQGVPQLDPESANDDLQFINAMEAVASLLTSVAKGLNFTLDVIRARLAANAQQIYQVAKGLALDRQGAAVRTHVEAMKKALRAKRRAAKPKPGVPIFAAAA